MEQVSSMNLRNKIFTIVLISLILIALISIVIGYAVIGMDVLAWLSSRWAYWIYAGVIGFLLVWGGLEVLDRIKKL